MSPPENGAAGDMSEEHPFLTVRHVDDLKESVQGLHRAVNQQTDALRHQTGALRHQVQEAKLLTAAVTELNKTVERLIFTLIPNPIP